MSEPPRGFRVFADVLLDVSDDTIPPDVTPLQWLRMRPQERAAILYLDTLKANRIDLCGTIHVSRLHRKVNPDTGEISWKM